MIYDISDYIASRWHNIATGAFSHETESLHMITHWFARKSPGSDVSIVSLGGKRERVRLRSRRWMIMEEWRISAAWRVHVSVCVSMEIWRKTEVGEIRLHTLLVMRKPEEEDRDVHGTKHTSKKSGERRESSGAGWSCHWVWRNKILHITKVVLLYPFSILSMCARGSGGSRFTLQQQNIEI